MAKAYSSFFFHIPQLHASPAPAFRSFLSLDQADSVVSRSTSAAADDDDRSVYTTYSHSTENTANTASSFFPYVSLRCHRCHRRRRRRRRS